MPSETKRGELTLDALREWVRQELERMSDEAAHYQTDSLETRSHRAGRANALYGVRRIIESGRLPND